MSIQIGDVEHTLRMVLNDNTGQVLTEALVLGIEASLLFYLRRLTPPEAQSTTYTSEV